MTGVNTSTSAREFELLNGDAGYEFEFTFLDSTSRVLDCSVGVPNGQGQYGSNAFVAGALP